MNSPPPVYETVRKSRLIPAGDLQTALGEFLTADALENHASPEEFDDAFLAFLERDALLNRWQISQLKKGRSRFRLGGYRVIDSLGSGGYGYVFLARTDADPSNFGVAESDGHRPYDRAIKTLIHSERHGPRAVERFRRENEINRLFLHPNLVRLLDSGEDAKVDYAVYEYMDGKSAFQLVAKTERLPGRTAAYIVSETAKGLFHLHQHGFIHRDIKPGNILFSRRGEVKLGDLGLAVPMDTEKFRPLLGSHLDDYRGEGGTSRLAGTSDYLSPDQIRSPGTPNVLWDIYSLGCTFFFLVAGFVPFPSGNSHQKLHAHLLAEAPDPKMYSPELPWDVARLISAMMDKDPAGRPASAEEVIKSLAPYAAGGREELKRLLKESLAPGPKPHYVPAPAAPEIDDGSESILLEALSNEITESLSSLNLSADEEAIDEILPPVIDGPVPDDAESGSLEEEPAGPDLAAALAPLLWFIAALLLALFTVLLFR